MFAVANRSVLISSPGILLLMFENKVGRVTVRMSENFGMEEVPFRIMMTLCQPVGQDQELYLPPMCVLPEPPLTPLYIWKCLQDNSEKSRRWVFVSDSH